MREGEKKTEPKNLFEKKKKNNKILLNEMSNEISCDSNSVILGTKLNFNEKKKGQNGVGFALMFLFQAKFEKQTYFFAQRKNLPQKRKP